MDFFPNYQGLSFVAVGVSKLHEVNCPEISLFVSLFGCGRMQSLSRTQRIIARRKILISVNEVFLIRAHRHRMRAVCRSSGSPTTAVYVMSAGNLNWVTEQKLILQT